jgi:ATP phosphoribosyltransferase regulatory subunit
MTSSGSALDHPLPAGMRDLLPEETIARRAIARAFLGRAELFGYETVTPPVFEYAETIERGLGTLDPREIVRFVEPETGEVVALRPDVTPQIARLVATRLSSRPSPYRLAYDASVLRRRSGSRARTHRQIPQLGVELIGAHGPAGDLELLVLAATSLQQMGLTAFTLDLGHAEIARALLADVAEPERTMLADALGAKDSARVERLTSSLAEDVAQPLRALPRLHGAPASFDSLPPAITRSKAMPAIESLRALVAQLEAALAREGVTAATIGVDLGEVRGHAYYTGPFFQLLAEGPGVPIGGGGRYDGLLARFGRPLPATGLALDVDALGWALRVAGAELLRAPRRYVVVEGEHAVRMASALRARGIPATVLPEADAEAYARAWGYAGVLRADASAIDATVADVAGPVAQVYPASGEKE